LRRTYERLRDEGIVSANRSAAGGLLASALPDPRNEARQFVERMNQPGPVPTMYSNPIMRASDDGIEAALRAKYPDAKINISGDAKSGYTLSRIELPKSRRSSGVGTSIMQDFAAMADAEGAKIRLTPSKDFGGSVPRLKDFYKRFGFVENKGKNKDFSTRETMYREPVFAFLPAPRNEAEAMARNILEMRAAGRAGDVTEEMRAAADPMYMYQNTPLPMDEASRMARAREMGRRDEFHGTTTGSDMVAPNAFRGTGARQGIGFVTSDNPYVASSYADPNAGAVFPMLNVPLPANAPRIDVGGNVWSDISVDTPVTIGDRVVTARQLSAEPADVGGVLSTNQLSRGASFDYPGIEFANIMDRSIHAPRPRTDDGMEIMREFQRLASDPSNVTMRQDTRGMRSRFALFDPEFAHLRNLSAGVGGLGLLGLGAYDAQQGERY
jgi:GNAT superfamily N-acetyltransferase